MGSTSLGELSTMRASDLSGNEIVCSPELGQVLIEECPELSVVHSDEKLCIISADVKDKEILALLKAQGHRLSPRFMDRFFIELDDDDCLRQELLTSFFTELAPCYRELVDVDRNLQNIGNLLTIIYSNIDRQKCGMIADFGCGIGLSVEVATCRGDTFLGIDPCPNMRHLAELNGLRTLAPVDLARLPPNSLKAAFASYVFHLIPEPGLLRLTWNRMDTGSVFAANFHKMQGIEQFRATMAELGGNNLALDARFESGTHGRYLAFRKP